MKICTKCNKESEGNFCVFCGEKLVEKNNQEIDSERNVFKYMTIILLVVVIGLAALLLYNKINNEECIANLESKISRLNRKITKLENENSDYMLEKAKYKEKADFLDEHVVLVLDGYGRYYYTYDQAEQVTQGREYSFWLYTEQNAKVDGYKKWK